MLRMIENEIRKEDEIELLLRSIRVGIDRGEHIRDWCTPGIALSFSSINFVIRKRTQGRDKPLISCFQL